MIRITAAVWLFFGLIGFGARAQETSMPDKGGYTLFNPVPSVLLRELSPDRPDKTESPYTVDAGHYQLEMDFANYTRDDSDGVRTRAWNVAPFNIKAGLLNKVDLQLIFDSYQHVRMDDHTTGTTITQSGVGNITARLKVNLWGNDGGQTALALLPYTKFPTSTDGLGNHAIEGGLLLPLAVKLPCGFDLGLETGTGFFQNGSDSNYHADFVNMATLGHAIAGKLSGYVEFFSGLSTERHSGWIGTVDFGLEFLVTENVQLDCGCNFGITRAADDFNPFAGITVRF